MDFGTAPGKGGGLLLAAIPPLWLGVRLRSLMPPNPFTLENKCRWQGLLRRTPSHPPSRKKADNGVSQQVKSTDAKPPLRRSMCHAS